MSKNNFGVKNQFLRRKYKGKKINIPRSVVEEAIAEYLKAGGKITILEALGTPVTNCNDDTADDFLME